MMEQMRERVARAIITANWPSLSGKDVDEMVEGYLFDADAALSLMQPEIDRRVAEERAKLLERLREPSEAIWDGLPRQIMMWLDMEPKTPRALFKHLELIGLEVPQWLRDEQEMQHLDHVPSKGTRCVLIFKAMLAQYEKEQQP